MQPKYLVVAHINRAQGLNGGVEVISLTDFPERFAPGVSLLPSPPVAKIGSLTIEEVEKRPKGLVFKFAEINTREEADRIAGCDLIVPIEEASKLSEDEYWIHDIVGMDVFTTDGSHLGHVTEVLRTGSNDVYVIHSSAEDDEHEHREDEGRAETHEGGREYLIPATKEVVKSISTKERKIIIEPIPGLLE